MCVTLSMLEILIFNYIRFIDIKIIAQYVLVNPDTSNHLIKRGTTITDVFAIYKETYKQLLTTKEDLEHSQLNFDILNQVRKSK